MIHEFVAWPKINRLHKMMCCITEKLDGTNACIYIPEGGSVVLAGSRSRWITPEDDNYGFARWVQTNKDELASTLGPGRHYGEWWGNGIQRRYGLDRKVFTLFNALRWKDTLPRAAHQVKEGSLLGHVNILYTGPYDPAVVKDISDDMRQQGSVSVPGWGNPEGLVVLLDKVAYKVILNGDEDKRAG